jgi:hypothetical protein
MFNCQLDHSSSRTTAQLLRFLLEACSQSPGKFISQGLPAGSLEVPGAGLIIGGTPCTVPLFGSAMELAARAQQCDVMIARHGTSPEILDSVLFDVAIFRKEQIAFVPDQILYCGRDGSHWLIPSGHGPHIRLTYHGLHLSHEPHFLTWDERCDGVCAAAKQIIAATKSVRL